MIREGVGAALEERRFEPVVNNAAEFRDCIAQETPAGLRSRAFLDIQPG